MENRCRTGSNREESKGDNPQQTLSQTTVGTGDDTHNVSTESYSILNGQGNNGNNDDLSLISQLVDKSNNLTRDLFVNQIITDYAELDDIRLRVFEAVKASDGYPYDPSVELKRRKNTYGGETKQQKIGKDIHTLIQILEGSEFHEMRDILSMSNSRNTNLDSSILASGITNNAEIECLKTVINSMKADILSLKQECNQLKTGLSKEVKEIKDSVKKLKIELQMDMSDIRDDVQTNAQSIDRIVDERCNGNAALKSDIRLLRIEIKDIHETLDTKTDNKRIENINEKHANLIKRVSKLEKSSRSKSTESTSITNTQTSSNDTTSSPPLVVDISDDTDKATPDPVVESVADKQNSVDTSYAEMTNRRPNVTEPVSEPNNHTKNTNVNMDRGNDKSIDLTSDVSVPYNRRPRYQNNYQRKDQNNRSNIIRGRGSRQNKDKPQNSEDTDNEDFEKYVCRRVKRYFVSGFKNSVTPDKLAKFVEAKGVTCTWVTIFPIRNSNRVTIRLNVEDNEKSEDVLRNTFWPRFVNCKPWVSKSQRDRERKSENKEYGRQRDDYNHRGYSRHDDDRYYDKDKYDRDNYDKDNYGRDSYDKDNYDKNRDYNSYNYQS